MATGGMSTPGSPHSAELTAEELAVGVDEAHKAGLRVAAHAHAAAGIRAALAAGVDSIEHGAFMGEDELAEMRQRGTFLVPTVVAVENVRPGSGIDPDVIAKTDAARKTFHANTATALRWASRSSRHRGHRAEPGGPNPPWRSEALRAARGGQQDGSGGSHRAGGRPDRPRTWGC